MQKPIIICECGVTIIAPASDGSLMDFNDHLFGELLEVVKSLEPPKLIVNLEQVSIINGTFLAFMINAYRQLKTKPEGRCGVCCLSSNCREIFEITKINHLIELFETQADAMMAYTTEAGAA